MKKLIVFACLATAVTMTASAAMADSIKGRVGVTGKIGFLIPADNEIDPFRNRTDAGFIGGVGIIYGFDDHIAAELEVTRTSFGSDTGDFGITNVSLGGQYRFALPRRQLVPYIGVGLDILASDYDPYPFYAPSNGSRLDVDTTLGVHISGGVDYFLQKMLALTVEAKLVAAPDTDITDRFGNSEGNFDPTSFSTTVGLRYFFN
jgi:outer membrane protein